MTYSLRLFGRAATATAVWYGGVAAMSSLADDPPKPSPGARGSNGAQEQKPAAKAPIYDEKADAREQIAAATARARRDNKHVLVMFGGNWCGWCYKLHDLFQKDREIATLLRNEYELVMVDIGHSDKNRDIPKEYGADIAKHGVPFLTVLDATGKVKTNQNTSDLEAGPIHDRAKVQQFLSRWVAARANAEEVFRDARARAAKEQKRLLVHFGAPW
jgi:thiol-disulfide isomerase/thioredoxin